MATKTIYMKNIHTTPLIVGRHTLQVGEYKKVMREQDLETDEVIDGLEKEWIELCEESEVPEDARKGKKDAPVIKVEAIDTTDSQGFETPAEAEKAYSEANAKAEESYSQEEKTDEPKRRTRAKRA